MTRRAFFALLGLPFITPPFPYNPIPLEVREGRLYYRGIPYGKLYTR